MNISETIQEILRVIKLKLLLDNRSLYYCLRENSFFSSGSAGIKASSIGAYSSSSSISPAFSLKNMTNNTK
tara:strand:+ start:695 stop:907 length:213 start_codon:yes stop_codon:yes gene_type:complete